jgi:hypothetical protein
MAKKTATATRTAKPAVNRPGARGAKAREGAPVARPGDRSVRNMRGAPPAAERRAREETIQVVRVRVRDDIRSGMIYYDNKRRRRGDVFDLLDPRHFNEEQMEKVSSRTRLRHTTSRQVLNEAHDDVLAKKFAESRQRGGPHTDDAPDDLEDTGGNPLDDE